MSDKDKGKNKQKMESKAGKEDENKVQGLVDRLPQIDVPRKPRSNTGTLYHEIPIIFSPSFEDVNIERRSRISTNLLPFKKRYLKLQINIPVDVIENDEDYQPQN